MRAARYAWVVVAILWVVWLLNYLDRQVIFSVFPPIQSELHLSNIELGLLGTSFLWVYAFFSPFAGFLADRYGRKRLIAISLFVWSAMTWMTGRAQSFSGLLWTRAGMGLSEACYLPAGLALIARHHSGRTRSLATSIHYTGAYLGTILGGFAGGWVGEHYGWRMVFALLGGIGLIYAIAVVSALREATTTETPERASGTPKFAASLRELFSLPGFAAMMFVFAAVSVGDWAVYTWMPVYLFERFHMSLAEAGFSATFYLKGGGVVGILAGGALADRFSRRSERGRLLTQAAGLLLAAPFLFFAGIAGSPVLLLVALALFGFGKAAYDCNTMPVLCQIARPDLRSTGFGIFNFAGCIAGGGVAAIAGAVKDTVGLGGTLQVAGAFLLLSGICLIRLPLRSAFDVGRTKAVPSHAGQ
jgi:MFS transporter, Spinster family, sphingosine-1-phosphate transporter